MANYRVRLTLQAPLGTPLHSGTLFGHLCWALRLRDGEAALSRWLEGLEAEPLLISDALPADHLPRPWLAPATPPRQADGQDRKAHLETLTRTKRLRKQAWMRVEDFLDLRTGLSESRLLQRFAAQGAAQTGQVLSRRQAHNTINRHTGTTPESGGLYFMAEYWHDAQASQKDVYLRTAMDGDDLKDLFKRIGDSGFGRDATLGRGRLSAEVKPADPRLFDHAGNRHLSLSHGALSDNM